MMSTLYWQHPNCMVGAGAGAGGAGAGGGGRRGHARELRAVWC